MIQRTKVKAIEERINPIYDLMFLYLGTRAISSVNTYFLLLRAKVKQSQGKSDR